MTNSEISAPDIISWRLVANETELGLAAAGIEAAGAEARWLVEEASGIAPGDWHARNEEPARVRGIAALDEMLSRRLIGEPIQYVLGSWAFRTLDLMVDHRVLIPRPETESLVDLALRELDRCVKQHPLVVDLGTGSGAIALAMAAEHPACEVLATDASQSALAVARVNVAGLGRPGARVRLFEGSWFDALPVEFKGDIDVIVSNPPYIAATETLPSSVQDWEPASALVAGPLGFECVEKILIEAWDWLTGDGAVVVEMTTAQTKRAVDLARDAGFGAIEVECDLRGIPRFVTARVTS